MMLLDIIKFFDKQSLVDACDALYKAEVNNKFYQVWYQLNENTQIKVRTGSGVSARGLAGPVTGQGGGWLLSPAPSTWTWGYRLILKGAWMKTATGQ